MFATQMDGLGVWVKDPLFLQIKKVKILVRQDWWAFSEPYSILFILSELFTETVTFWQMEKGADYT